MKLLKWGEAELAAAGIDTARLDAGILLDRFPNTGLFRRSVKQRASRYPLQYILNETEFMGLALKLRENVFIPRPETEILSEKAIEIAINMDRYPVSVLEIGTGSGNIAISLTKNVTNCRIIASDISDVALETAAQNAEMNTVSGQIEFVKSNLFDNISSVYSGYFDIIISNPPYVKRDEIKHLQPEIAHEDIKALDGGIDGLDFYRAILAGGRHYLRAGGVFLFEIGYDQAVAVAKIAEQYPELGEVKFFKDYNNYARVAIVKYTKGACDTSWY
ncbi:MAG: peptide chain release factor N(5)-glutamine methyltransferase [Candidatus Omnitrophota bacterium]|nr:peptide chain release factor N(5)-glutamine methyltransferase [Candidatus Omnitrophota bacterium]